MQGMYGSAWVDRWRTGVVESGVDQGMLNAKSVWAEGLAGFAAQPERIAKALEACKSLPKVPSLPEFIALCRQQHANAPRVLPAPTLSSEQIDQRVSELAGAVRADRRESDGLAWARRAREDYLNRMSLPPITIQYASEVLGEVWCDGKCVAANQREAA